MRVSRVEAGDTPTSGKAFGCRGGVRRGDCEAYRDQRISAENSAIGSTRRARTHMGAPHAQPEVVVTARQDRVFREENPTVGGRRWLLVQAMFMQRRTPTHYAAGVQSHHSEYRLHTSFIKDLAPEMGRGVRLTYTVNVF